MYFIYNLKKAVIQHAIKIVNAADSEANNNISVINSFLLLQFLKLLYINTYGITVPNNNDITKNGIINLDILGFTIFNIIKCPNPNIMTGIILAKSFSLANANSIPSFSFLSFLFFFK